MKQIVAFVLGCIVSVNVATSAEILKAVVAPLAKKSLLLDIVVVDEGKVVVVGERGHILTSQNGQDWQQANVPIQSTLTSVYFHNENLGWAVGHDASILHTSDGGKNWIVQQFLPSLEKPFLDVIFNNGNEGIAIGAYGQFYRTMDGGSHWSSEFHSEFLLPEDAEFLEELKAKDEESYLDERASILPHFNRILRDGRTLYMVGEIGLMAKSNDFGRHWEKLDDIYQGSFFDIIRTKQGSLIVVGLRGHAFRSVTNGISWQEINTNTTALLNDVVLGDDNQIFLLGNNGVLLQSLDDGLTFSPKTQSDGKALIAGVWFNDKIIVVSDVGLKSIQINSSQINSGLNN